jgi:glycosyltransferase involved in cell wall biosynthesis
MSSPRVSVVVTCFNLGAYLGEALESIRTQTFKDYEICLVDDGSTDQATKQALREVGPDVVVISSPNQGLSAARNLGVSRTAGEFICAVDADDVLVPTLLERSVAWLDAHPELAFVSHWREAFGDQSWEWKPERCDLQTLLDVNTVNGAALVRRTAVEAVGGWDESMRDGLEDWNFWIALVERGYRGGIIPEILFRYRQRPDSMSRVNFAGSGHARLYRHLVERHPDSFSDHLQSLAVRRHVDMAAGWALDDELKEHLELHALPALARARDDVVEAERRCIRWHSEKSNESAARQQMAEIESARQLAARLAADCQLLTGEVADLRASLSWRLTAPLRSVGALVKRALRRQS